MSVPYPYLLRFLGLSVFAVHWHRANQVRVATNIVENQGRLREWHEMGFLVRSCETISLFSASMALLGYSVGGENILVNATLGSFIGTLVAALIDVTKTRIYYMSCGEAMKVTPATVLSSLFPFRGEFPFVSRKKI